MKRLLGIATVLFILGAAPALAVTCPGTLQLKDNAGTVTTGLYTNDGAGNCQANVAAKDGSDVAEGTTTDAAVTTNTTGTLSGKLRGIVAILADVWDSVNHRLHVNVDNTNANGRATAANSSPVVQPSAPSQWHLIAAASTNATSIKASAAVVFSCQLSGIGSTPAYLKIYNKASAPTVGTDTPVKTLIIPAAATAANGAGSNIQFGPGGMALGTGFAAAVTGGITDADTTAVAASTFAINCDYE